MNLDNLSPLQLGADIVERYRISSLKALLDVCRTFEQQGPLNIAVFGRFKAGKSSFLNTVLGIDLLPVGVVPVTAIITEVVYSPSERIAVRSLDGGVREISRGNIPDYVDESRNPENTKQVQSIRIEIPSLARFKGICFVDTPGLESVLTHNTEASQDWFPNVGLAVVTVAVDPPLSQNDVDLIRNLQRYTPNVSVLITKVDTLNERQRMQVLEYVRSQLARYLDSSIPVFPYSIRSGFESLRDDFDRLLLDESARVGEHREAILNRKTETLLRECGEYLALALKSATTEDSERQLLGDRILGQKRAIDDTKTALRLIVRHAAASTRTANDRILKRYEKPSNDGLRADFEKQFPRWTSSLKEAAESFETWLHAAMTEKISAISAERRTDFLEPIHVVGRQLSQSLQDFRNRVSEAAISAIGVPLRTTEVEIDIHSPRLPDIRIGKIFDTNWELLSFLIPMTLVKRILARHFRWKIRDAVEKNLSRLAFQWEEIVNAGLTQMENEALLRIDSLIATIEHLLCSAPDTASMIQEDLANLGRSSLKLRS